MTIPDSQLETWSKQGSVVQSRDTYATVKSALEDKNSPYWLNAFETFLQGSYGNDTNVYRDSDVDVVMRLDSTFYHDAYALPADQYRAFEGAYPGTAAYGLDSFKKDVFSWLASKFGNTVRSGKKAIFVPGNGVRRDCDVLTCAKFRHYYRFGSQQDQLMAEGICFFLPDGTRVVNYPKQHSENCTTKHQATNGWFKPTMRMYKNMRNYMVDRGMLADGVAPSYFIEGMLHNVPNGSFGKSYEDTFVATYNYVVSADRTQFRCANDIHSLLGDTPVTWPAANCQTFLNALRQLWNGGY